MEKKPPSTTQKLNFKKVLPIFVIVFVNLLGLTIILPLLPLYATTFGADPFTIGALGTTYPVMQFIGAPILGRLSDRFGRKPVLIISQFGTFIGFILLGTAETLWLIFVSRVIDGISGANIATAQAAISDSTTPETRTQGLGLIGAAFGLGFIIGPIIAGVALTLTNNNYQVPAFIAAFFSAVSILLTVTWFEETLPQEKRISGKQNSQFSLTAMLRALRHPAVGLLLVLMFAQQVAFGGFEQLLPLFTFSRLGLNAVGNTWLFVFIGIIVVIIQGGLIGRLSRRFGDRRLIYANLLLMGLGLFALGLTPRQPVPWYSQAAMEAEMGLSPESEIAGERVGTQEIQIKPPAEADKSWVGLSWMLVALVPISISGGVLRPTINSLITKRVDENEVGGLLGISAAFSSAANAVTPIVGGALFQIFSDSTPFLSWGALLFALFWTAVRYLRAGAEEKSAEIITVTD